MARWVIAVGAVLVLGVALGLAGWAIGRAGGEAVTVTVTATAPEPPPDPAEAQPVAGSEAYVTAGCQVCHGLAGEGTKIAPAVAGHSREQVRRQVRSPLATMPAYTARQLPDDELEAIAVFVEELAPTEAHVEPVDLPDVVAVHHWLALSAIDAGSLEDAAHHIEHVIEAVEGEHRSAMQRALQQLERGDTHEASHVIEEMLAKEQKPGLGVETLHLQLALSAVDARDRAGAVHHVNHFLETARGEQRDAGRTILRQLQANDLHGAAHGLADLLGVERD